MQFGKVPLIVIGTWKCHGQNQFKREQDAENNGLVIGRVCLIVDAAKRSGNELNQIALESVTTLVIVLPYRDSKTK